MEEASESEKLARRDEMRLARRGKAIVIREERKLSSEN
jgi:hypothetical protein